MPPETPWQFPMGSWNFPSMGDVPSGALNYAPAPINGTPGNDFSFAGQAPGFTAASTPGNPLTGTGVGGTPSIGALGWGQMGLYGANTLGNLWGAWQANKLAKQQLSFTKDIGNANLNNSIKSYNTTLADRAGSRAAMEGWSPERTQAYIAENKLTR